MIPKAPPIPNLLPPDATAALKSFSQRYRKLMERVPLESRAELGERIGPDGVTALSLLTSVAHDLSELEEALRQVLHQTGVSFDANPLDHDSSDEPYLGLDVALERVERRCDELGALATEAERSIGDWNRTGTGPDGTVTSAWQLAQEAVAIASHRLRLIETIVSRI